jgi:ferric-dicitrate binding protein FerR (iron transport regulator)
MANHDDDGGLDRAELDRWVAPEPRPEFEDQVISRLEATGAFAAAPAASPSAPSPSTAPSPAPSPPPTSPLRPRTRTRTAALLGFGAGVVAAAAVAFLVASRDRAQHSLAGTATAGGRLEATGSRRSVDIAGRAVAVAEAGSALEWRVDADGGTSVAQLRGRIFYRVDRGAPFRVATPRGEVAVRGTCFTVGIDDAGAEVFVHEGQVEVSGAGRTLGLAAGEAALLAAGGPRRVTADEATALLAGRSAAAPAALLPPRSGPSLSPSPPPDDLGAGGARFEPDAATLARWAQECRIRVDLPPVTAQPLTPVELDALASSLALRPGERAAVARAIETISQRAIAHLGRLYVDVTGDEEGARSLSLDLQMHEILRSAELGEEQALRRRISRERAGLEPPPPAGAAMTPVEEMVRAIVAVGDELEAELAREVGPERARALRRANRGWPGSEFHWLGCPAPGQDQDP